MYKKYLFLVLILSSAISSFASENWISDLQGYIPARNYAAFLRLQELFPEKFPDNVPETDFQSAGVRIYYWLYVGATTCEVNDPRLQTQTFTTQFCTIESCISSPDRPYPVSDEDPCLP